MFEFTGFAGLPGIDALRETIEADFTWGNWEHNKSFVFPIMLDGSARDAGNSPTTILRPGLLLQADGTTKLWSQWATGATLGGVLLYAAQTQMDGADADRWFGYALVGGQVQATKLLVPGQANYSIVGQGLEAEIRTAMEGRFWLDDIPYL